MFKISAINDKQLQKQYAEACGCKFCPDFFAYSMINLEDGELMGYSEFDILGECGYISALAPRVGCSDFEAMFILGRQTMNFIDLCGIHKCKAAKNAGEERLLRSIGFTELDDGSWFADMDGMFDGKCDGKPIKL